MKTFTQNDGPRNAANIVGGRTPVESVCSGNIAPQNSYQLSPLESQRFPTQQNNSRRMITFTKKGGGGVPRRISHAKPLFRSEAIPSRRAARYAGGGS